MIFPKRIFYLLLGFLIFICAGAGYSWSVLKAPLETAFGWTPAQLTMNYTFFTLSFTVGLSVNGHLPKKAPISLRLIFSACLLVLGFFTTPFLSSQNIFPLYICWGIGGGLGCGIIYCTLVAAIKAWFPDCQGVAVGILTLGFGVSPLFLSNLANGLFQSKIFDWRQGYFIFGTVLLIIMTVASCFFRLPGPQQKFPEPRHVPNRLMAGFEQDFTTREMVKRPSFWLLFLYLAALDALGNVIIAFSQDIILRFDVEASAAAFFVGLLSVVNGVGRIVLGKATDRWGCRCIMFVSGGLAVAAPLCILISLKNSIFVFGLLGLAASYFVYAGLAVLLAIIPEHYYGKKYFVQNYGIFGLAGLITAVLVSATGVMVTASGGFISTLIVVSIFCVITNLGILLVKCP